MRERIREIYRKHTPSVKLPLIILTVLFCMIPLLVESRILASSSRQEQVERRIIDVQNQCQILSNKMSRSGYLTNSALDNAAIDTELSLLSDIFSGRILIVNSGFKIVEDTFAISDGKTLISDEVIRCFQGENTSRYDSLKHYFVLAIPIPEFEQETGTITTGKTAGVMIVTASTESMYSLEESLKDKASLYEMMIFVIVLIVTILSVHLIMKPFGTLIASIRRAGDGNLDEDVNEEAYRETKQISGTINKTLEKLKAVDQSRQEFVSNVSHELKTPITSIRVLADSLMGMEDAPKELYQEFMHDISDEIDRESKIIDDLLTLVRMDKASSELSCTQVQINGLIEMVLKRLRPIARKRNIELIFESKRDVTADIDEVKFSLAINNLVENAVKYNKEDGWVRVTLDADHKFFYLKVADSGIGIPAEFKERVFERFYRVDKARSRETGGTGLGLAITRSVVLMHHGAIRVDSVEGEGSTFMVRIPLIYIP
ncbi:sensor histidine kinase [Clostridium sp. AF37-5AT]|nr:sensor histidine kinase [Clostridium sp. AM16-23]RHO93989.1 sensor histidine kinase [Clostridium sp. AF37-5AT]RHR03386.1 sensor histidine kinase [Clostridium sp. AF20-17LB]RHS68815.1 sensor histidine kinase [Clostridium sp. AM45-5]RHV97606.1 sensor histidine kinase [Clostridium sp. OF09-10]